MKYIEALEQIKRGQIKHIYLIHGEETFLAKKMEQALISALLSSEERDMGLSLLDSDPEPKELINMVETYPFMSSCNVIVIRNTKLFKAGKNKDTSLKDEEGHLNNEVFLKVLSNIPEFTYLIFLTPDKIDKRRKIYKMVETHGEAIETAALKVKEVREWLHVKLKDNNKKIAPDAMEYILSAISVMPQISLGFLDKEIDKLLVYVEPDDLITKRAVDDVFAAIPEVSVFAMLEALSQKQADKAIALFHEQLTAGQHPLQLTSLLAHQIRRLWQTKELAAKGCFGREIAEHFKVPTFIGEKLLSQSKCFSVETLKQAMLSLTTANSELKYGGAGAVVLEKIIIEFCR